jgi:hypothetical protein
MCRPGKDYRGGKKESSENSELFILVHKAGIERKV